MFHYENSISMKTNGRQRGSSLIPIITLAAVTAVVLLGDKFFEQLRYSFAKSIGEPVANLVKDKVNPSDSPISTPTPKGSNEPSPSAKAGASSPTPVASPPPPTGDEPYPGAASCPDTGASHDNSKFHTLWDPSRRCHYDHEHGQTPFTSEIANMFPGFNLKQLLGNVEIGSTNPSGSVENTLKHGGFKWQVGQTPQGCVSGFEGAVYCVSNYAIQYHNFGDYSIEMDARIHTAASMMKVCNPANPSDCGYMYVVQFADYGQRISGYQGDLLPFPNNPIPSYPTGFGPYLSVDCVGVKGSGQHGVCFPTLESIRDQNRNTNSIWTTKKTGTSTAQGSSLFKLLFRLRDTYQVVKWGDGGSIPTYPFTFLFVCGGENYNPIGCRWNNSTSTIHEVAGIVPASWDGASFDRDARAGRVTAEGFVTKFGQWNSSCMGASTANDCFPIKMVGMYVGFYGSELSVAKVSNTTPENTPERDFYFCNGILCNERDAGAVPSGWINKYN